MSERPLFPATAPPAITDDAWTSAAFERVLASLEDLVEVAEADLDLPTPCDGFDVRALRHHVLAWLQFFAAALSDPGGSTTRLDPETWELGTNEDPRRIVQAAAAAIRAAIEAGVRDEVVVMSQARMEGGAVLSMALGEYLVHGWDLAVATGRRYEDDDESAGPALEFLQSTVAPEYRGPDTGFFDAEVEPPPDASPFVRLLCFAGRHPDAG